MTRFKIHRGVYKGDFELASDSIGGKLNRTSRDLYNTEGIKSPLCRFELVFRMFCSAGLRSFLNRVTVTGTTNDF